MSNPYSPGDEAQRIASSAAFDPSQNTNGLSKTKGYLFSDFAISRLYSSPVATTKGPSLSLAKSQAKAG
jgi:hypothetical protein